MRRCTTVSVIPCASRDLGGPGSRARIYSRRQSGLVAFTNLRAFSETRYTLTSSFFLSFSSSFLIISNKYNQRCVASHFSGDCMPSCSICTKWSNILIHMDGCITGVTHNGTPHLVPCMWGVFFCVCVSLPAILTCLPAVCCAVC